jgi:hypothetical protein
VSVETAKTLVAEFTSRSDPGAFPQIARADVAAQVAVRIESPGAIDQGSSSLCGPASLMYHLALDDPAAYAAYIFGLYEAGVGRIGDLVVEPGTDLRNYAPDPDEIAAADWIALAGLRDSENLFFNYDSTDDEFAGITLPGGLEKWLQAAGYDDVRERANSVWRMGRQNAEEASELLGQGYRVCLFTNSKMLDGDTHDNFSLTADHWVVLTSPMTFTDEHVSFRIYTWGDAGRLVPQEGELEIGSFLRNYYGFVAGRHQR